MRKFLNTGNYRFKEKRSEFIGYSFSIANASELNKILKELKSQNPNARHLCWGYRFYNSGSITENSTDGGEPSGSAGMPILSELQSKNIINGAIIVIRYFGGVKLGKRGLIDAYRAAAKGAIDASKLGKWQPQATININASIEQYGSVAQCIQKFDCKILSDNSSKMLNMELQIKESAQKEFEILFMEITKSEGEIKKQSEHDQTKEVRK